MKKGGFLIVDVSIWRWTIENIENSTITSMASSINLKIKGFNNVKTLHLNENFNMLKKMIVKEMLKPKILFQLTQKLNQNNEKIIESELFKLREMNLEDIINYIDHSKIDLPDVFLVLLTNPKSDDLVQELFNYLKDNGQISDFEIKSNVINQENNEIKEEENLKQENTILEKKLKEQIEKNKLLQKEINNLKNQKSQKENDYNKNKVKFEKLVAKLKRDLLQKEIRDKELLEKIGVLQNEIQKKEEQLKTKEVKVELKNNKLPNKVDQEEKTEKTTIILIGEISHLILSMCKQCHIIVVDNNEVELLLENPDIPKVDEVWVLKFNISLEKQRKIKKYFYSNQLIEFNDFNELKKYIGNFKGLSSYDK